MSEVPDVWYVITYKRTQDFIFNEFIDIIIKPTLHGSFVGTCHHYRKAYAVVLNYDWKHVALCSPEEWKEYGYTIT